ncbi:hypothetical protein TEA_027960 [Camellia sinensis var. sinensis]|uniref:histone deacetylase n=1 Tax=Camellia sinensis var. sinensis TaxID=542762 RepID=A0A4S4F1R6_CAMSN|nr:hypothetical protein TEA_027960 [Camellia sinensis var. sinensis]
MELNSGSETRRRRRVGLIYDDRMCKHFTPDGDYHPENPNRILSIWKKLQSSGIPQRCVVLSAKEAEDKYIAAVHTKNHIDLIKTISSKKLDSRRHRIAAKFNSIYFNEGSSEAAHLAAGSVLEVTEKVAKGELDSAFAIVRPPGHHAEEDEPMGFCLYNNVAVATSFLLNERQELGINKILIVDWDVHHGNGTQKMFWKDPRVLFFSVHRHEFGSFYPASDDGSHIMVGEGPGAGYNINVPWENGRCGDADYLAVWDHVLIPIAKEFRPDIIIISAGFDAAIGDPLGGCCVTPCGYAILLKKLMEFAQGKIVMALEGGYNLDSLANSVLACVEVLLEDKPIIGLSEAYPFESTWRVIQSVREQLCTFWSILKGEIPKKLTSRKTSLIQTKAPKSPKPKEFVKPCLAKQSTNLAKHPSRHFMKARKGKNIVSDSSASLSFSKEPYEKVSVGKNNPLGEAKPSIESTKPPSKHFKMKARKGKHIVLDSSSSSLSLSSSTSSSSKESFEGVSTGEVSPPFVNKNKPLGETKPNLTKSPFRRFKMKARKGKNIVPDSSASSSKESEGISTSKNKPLGEAKPSTDSSKAHSKRFQIKARKGKNIVLDSFSSSSSSKESFEEHKSLGETKPSTDSTKPPFRRFKMKARKGKNIVLESSTSSSSSKRSLEGVSTCKVSLSFVNNVRMAIVLLPSLLAKVTVISSPDFDVENDNSPRTISQDLEKAVQDVIQPLSEMRVGAHSNDEVNTGCSSWRSEFSKIDVWYASYGSNMWKSRFLCYIEGGQVEGMKNPCSGSLDKRPPKEIIWKTVPHRLFFGRDHTKTWGPGGVAFLDPESNSQDKAYMCIYRITLEQFNDVLLQENVPGYDMSSPLFDLTDLDSVMKNQYFPVEALEGGWYYNVVHMGNENGIPILTMTCTISAVEKFKSGKFPLSAPAKGYVNILVRGLEEGKQLSEEEAMAYILEASTKPLL